MVKVELDIKDENLEDMIRAGIMKYFEAHGIIPFIRECVKDEVTKSPFYKDKFLTAVHKLNGRVHNLEMHKCKKCRKK